MPVQFHALFRYHGPALALRSVTVRNAVSGLPLPSLCRAGARVALLYINPAFTRRRPVSFLRPGPARGYRR